MYTLILPNVVCSREMRIKHFSLWNFWLFSTINKRCLLSSHVTPFIFYLPAYHWIEAFHLVYIFRNTNFIIRNGWFWTKKMHHSKYHSTIPKHDYSISCAIQLFRDIIIQSNRPKIFSFTTGHRDISLYRKPTSVGFNLIYWLEIC